MNAPTTPQPRARLRCRALRSWPAASGALLVLAAWLLWPSPRARAATLTLTPVADADIEQFQPDSNFGSATSMASGELGSSAGNELRRALLRFDLAGQIPAGAVINSVSVQVHVVRVSASLVSSNFELRRLLQPWGEMAVSWNSRLASVSWQQPGAEGAGDLLATASATVLVSGVGTYTFAATPGLLADVQAWVAAPSTNCGWLLVSQGEGTPFTACRFGTHEDAANAPALVLDYSLPDPQLLTQPQSQTVQQEGTATFSVSATGTPPLSYQWLFFGNPIPDATNDTLVLTNVQSAQAGDYSVQVSGPNGVTNSQTATLSVSALPVPSVVFLSPTNDTQIPAQSMLLVSIEGSETNGVITQLELFLDGNPVQLSTNNPLSVLLASPAPGTHLLGATAMDGFGTLVSNSISFSVLAPPPVPDSIPPKLRITRSPPDFARLSSPLVSLAGTASDNLGLERVEVQLNQGPFQPAQGTNAWTAELTLAPGPNTLHVRSVDLAGNTSETATRFLTFVVTAPLSVSTTGLGAVSPHLDGRLLELGKRFRLTAHPAPGQLFAGWTGVANTQGPVLDFLMASNLALVAQFVPNPFPAVSGNYSGLFVDTNHPAPESAGFVHLRLSRRGGFSGQLAMNGARYPFHGRFNTLGMATLPVLRPARTPVVLGLQVDLSGGADALSGFATNAVGTQVVVSSLLARRNGFSPAAPAPQLGQHPFLLQNPPDEGGAIMGSGLASIGSAGRVRFLGALTEGTRWSLSSALAGDGEVPFYFPLERGSGCLLGWVTFPLDPAAAPSGSLLWVNSGTNGFARLLEVVPAVP